MKTPWTRDIPARLKQHDSDEGIAFCPMGASPQEWWASPNALPPSLHPAAAYLGQLANEGHATTKDGAVIVPWASIFALQADQQHASSLGLLELPASSDCAPILESRGVPSDPEFRIAIVGWLSPRFGIRSMRRVGAILEEGGNRCLMSESAWRLSRLVSDFASRASELSPEQRSYALGEIRELAIASGASLDDYLQRTEIVSPNRLEIGLFRADAMGSQVVEVEPRPVGAPPEFLKAFDRYGTVQARYDISQSGGRMVHVAPSPAVAGALSAIKAMPGRRLASEQARLFGHNPYAVLGDDAREALDEEALIRAREEAGLLPYRMAIRSEGDNTAPTIQFIPLSETRATTEFVATTENVKRLLEVSSSSRAKGLPLFHWDGHEIELSPTTEQVLAQLASWLDCASIAAVGLTLAEVLNLEAYSDRVVGFEARLQTVPYVARRESGTGWIPENIQTGIAVVDRETGSTQNIAMPDGAVDELKNRIGSAIKDGRPEVELPNSNVSVPVERAQQLVAILQRADISIGKKKSPPSGTSDPKSDGKRAILQILHNIEDLDYVTKTIAQVDASDHAGDCLPAALRSDVTLLPHQREGLAWLQKRYGMQREGMSGCLLADDMGLGKTLQSLCLIAWHHETTERPKPCLVVAPVSLLENWKLEINKFLGWEPSEVLSLYGPSLGSLRLSPTSIDEGLAGAGINKLLRPGFEAGYKVILTTYETLRDYEFSLARVGWGVVVCDEAQKIKNPAAFVTQAAKALRAEFRIACTGTPVENSLADLWCLFDYFQPGYLGSLNEFTRLYRRKIEGREDGHEALVEQLRRVTKPWVLRRMKGDVHRGLPAKLQGNDADATCLAIPMSPMQARLYAETVATYRACQDEREAGKGTQILALISRLRMICANPLSLLSPDHETKPLAEHLSASPKLGWLLGRLNEVRKRDEKAIVFTEFRDLQRLLQRAIAERFGYPAQIINGSTVVDARHDASRQRLIDQFQAQPGFGVIILSTTAVGFGVNIQAANHVVHFTRPWNPAKEDQATDRAYRIGQEKDVFVYCPTLVGSGFESFEERLANLLESKRELSQDMLSGVQEVTAEDFVDL